MIIYKLHYEDKLQDTMKIGFYLGEDMVDAAAQFYLKHEENKFRLMKMEYVGRMATTNIKLKE